VDVCWIVENRKNKVGGEGDKRYGAFRSLKNKNVFDNHNIVDG